VYLIRYTNADEGGVRFRIEDLWFSVWGLGLYSVPDPIYEC